MLTFTCRTSKDKLKAQTKKPHPTKYLIDILHQKKRREKSYEIPFDIPKEKRKVK